jgi:hypothetical protein
MEYIYDGTLTESEHTEKELRIDVDMDIKHAMTLKQYGYMCADVCDRSFCQCGDGF